MRVFKNEVGSMSPQFDGIAKSGRSVTLTGDGHIDIPLGTFVSRDSVGSYVDGGILKFAAKEEERYEDGILLAEEAGTNLIPNSDFPTLEGGGWVLGRTEVDDTQTSLTPDNIRSVGKLKITDITVPLVKVQAVITGNEEFTASMFVKAGEVTQIKIIIYRADPLAGHGTTIVDLTTGEVLSSDDTNFEITELINGWFRISSKTIGSVSTTEKDFLQVVLHNNNSVGNGLYVFGGQIEENSEITSYMSTNDWVNEDLVIDYDFETETTEYESYPTRKADVWTPTSQVLYYDYDGAEFKSSDREDLVVAHRGFADYRPENTMIAFKNAFENYGCRNLECDVQISSDGVPMIMHDDTLDRTTNGTGELKDKTYSELVDLDAGSWFDPIYSYAKIPTFEEFLIYCRDNNINIMPEVKKYRTIEDIDIIVNMIIEYGFEYKCSLQSFLPEDITYIRSINSNITVGYLSSTYSINDVIANKPAVIINPGSFWNSSPSSITEAKDNGIQIASYVAHSDTEYKEMIDLGMDYVLGNVNYFPNLINTKYTLENGKFGTICKLQTNSFSFEDITAINARPELLIGWYLGTEVLPSGLMKFSDDTLFYLLDGVMAELTYEETLAPMTDAIYDNSGGGHDVVTPIENGFNVVLDGANPYEYGSTFYRLPNPYPNFARRPVRVEEVFKVNSGQIHGIAIGAGFQSYEGSTGWSISDADPDKVINPGETYTKTNIIFPQDWGLLFWGMQVNEINSPNYNADFTMFLYEITSEVLEIKGTYTQDNNESDGVQDIFLDFNTNGLPIGTNTGKCNPTTGGYVNFSLVVTPEASIQYMCSGLLEDLDGNGLGLDTFSERTERRILEYGGGLPTRYMINGILQGYVPALPSQTELILNDTALIGHPDKISYFWGSDTESNIEKFRYFSKNGMIIGT